LKTLKWKADYPIVQNNYQWACSASRQRHVVAAAAASGMTQKHCMPAV